MTYILQGCLACSPFYNASSDTFTTPLYFNTLIAALKIKMNLPGYCNVLIIKSVKFFLVDQDYFRVLLFGLLKHDWQFGIRSDDDGDVRLDDTSLFECDFLSG